MISTLNILLAQINPTVGDLTGNLSKIVNCIRKAREGKADFLLFPELVLSGYPPDDLLIDSPFIQACEEALYKILPETEGIVVVLGLPRRIKGEKPLANSAAILSDGKVIGYQDKTLLPTYDLFDERRYFEPAQEQKVWNLKGMKVAITICEDLWQHSQLSQVDYAKDPIAQLLPLKPNLLFNLSASPFSKGKSNQREQVCSKAAKTLQCPLYLCNQIGANDGIIFDGQSLFCNASGTVTGKAIAFQEELWNPHHAKNALLSSSTEELYQALILGIRDYFQKLGFKKACLGLSGGIDSAIVACLAKEALGGENVLAIGMPSRYTSTQSLVDAQALVKNLIIAYREISIENPFDAFISLLDPYFEGKSIDLTEENLQARIRGMLLMAFSNKFGYLVLSTGNKSELALGYCTLYGDMCGGLAPIGDLLKEEVYRLAHWINREREIIPQSILQKAPSAELRPNQKDSDTLPEYAIVDRVIRDYIERSLDPETLIQESQIDPSLVYALIKKMHQNEYKRSQAPLALRVSERSFSTGRRFPIVQRFY